MSVQERDLLPHLEIEAPVSLLAPIEQWPRLWGSAALRQSPYLHARVRLRGALNRQALQDALNSMIADHAVLRSEYHEHDDQLVLVTSSSANASIAEGENESEEAFSGPFIRCRLTLVANRVFVLEIAAHRLVCDRWSLQALTHDLFVRYASLVSGATATFARTATAVHLPMRTLSLQSDDPAQHLHYWRAKFSDAPALVQLPTDHPRAASPTKYRTDRIPVEIPTPVAQAVRGFADAQCVTNQVVLLCAWAATLCRWTGQRQVVIGVRTGRSAAPSVDNILPILVAPGELSLEQLVRQVEQALQEAYAHRAVPIECIADALSGLGNEGSLLQVCMDVNDVPLDTSAVRDLATLGLLADEIEFLDERPGQELLLSLSDVPSASTLTGTLYYALDLFERSTVERLAECWQTLLAQSLDHSRNPLTRVPMLTQAMRDVVTVTFNRTDAAGSDDLIHGLVEQQVHRTPHAIALKYDGQTLSFAQLNRRANQLARHLRARGVQPDCLVALYVYRGIDMVVGMLGILKAGGAYVPLDPAYPTERLKYMLENARPRIVVTQHELRQLVSTRAQDVVALDTDWTEISLCEDEDLSAAEVGLTSSSLAYVIYTSGSTGLPKGAMNEHRGMVNRLLSQRNIEMIRDDDVCSQRTSLSFVDSVFETFSALCTGAPLVIVPGTVLANPIELAALIARENVTRLTTVPSLAKSMLDSTRLIHDLAALRSWTLSGEEVRPELLSKLQQALPECEFIIQYGSSEVSSDAAIHKTRRLTHEAVPIGRPLQNVRIYILDPYGAPVPVGVAGEICVAGVGVGRGYVNNPQLTNEKFTPDPFSADPHARLYKTGDLGRWRDDGTIEYLGRKDNQVKVRGFRIELGEIEAQLLRHDRVREAVVLLRENRSGLKQLVAYVTSRAIAPSVDDLRRRLQARLPEFMVPAAFVVLEHMPLTPNGKLDRRALPAPAENAFSARPFEPPANKAEQMLAGVWSELLGVQRIGRHDHFFELGGHSLQIVMMIERLREVGLTAHARQVFESPTLADMAKTLESGVADEIAASGGIPLECEVITPEMVPLAQLEAEHIETITAGVPGGAHNILDIYPVTPLQEGLLFHHLLDGDAADTYVASTILSVASKDRLEDLLCALQRVIDRHDALRTAFVWEKLPRALQVVHRKATLPVTIVPPRGAGFGGAIDDWLDAACERMDIRKAPLIRVYAAPWSGSEQWLILLQLHHMIDDDVSLKIMIGEIVAFMDNRARETPPPVRYRDHVARILEHAQSTDAEPFFRGKLQDVEESTTPFGLTNVRGDGSTVREARLELKEALAKPLRAQARNLGVSVAALFHAVWSLVVARTSGRDDVVFGTILLGRLSGSVGAQRALGMFINTLPIRLKLECSAKALVEQAHHELIALLPFEHASLAVAQRCSGVGGAAPLFSAVLNFRRGGMDLRAEWARAEGVQVAAVIDRTNYPISLSVDDTGDEFLLTAQTERTIDPNCIIAYTQMAARSLIEALETLPDTPALLIDVMPSDERQRLLGFNHTKSFRRNDALIPEMFEEQARLWPDEVAVSFGDRELTYSELQAKANRVAQMLISCAVAPNTFVALYVERGLDMVIGLLGILKAGGAYVPMDVTYPAERVAHMLRDSAPVAVLTQTPLKDRLPMTRSAVLTLDTLDEWTSTTSRDALRDVCSTLRPNDLSYVIYTSGSTGLPKGVMLEHGGLANLINWAIAEFDIRRGSRSSCVAAIGFDAATYEIWPVLCAGGTLVLPPPDTRDDVERLLDWWSNQALDLSFLPTPVAEFAFARGIKSPAVRHLMVGGDRLRSAPPNDAPPLINCYGPTEITVMVTTGRIRPGDKCLHIGAPLSNTSVYILNKHRQLVPLGVQGELFIGGAGVARGYLNRPSLTASSFTADPFSAQPHARMYRSGDLGIWRDDGTIDYRGRGDDQVKIRGFRIELGEIEATLTRQPDVSEAVVQVRESPRGEPTLVAYVVASGELRDLRDRLARFLPEYMVPSAFVFLERMPLTPNGKIDKRALPAPDHSGGASEIDAVPLGAVEEALADVWKSLLNVSNVGRDHSFFELGGHSLLATQMLVRIRTRLGVDVSMRTLFKCATLRRLAEHIEHTRTLDLVMNEGVDTEQLMERLASMSDEDARALLQSMEIRGGI